MFDLAQTAAAIVDRLQSEVAALETVAYIDRDQQSDRYPVTMPAAFVTMDRVRDCKTHNRAMATTIVWAVVVRGKQLDGPDGLLAVIDQVSGSLSGYQPAGKQQLDLLEIQFYDIQAESAAWIIRFQARARATTRGCRDE